MNYKCAICGIDYETIHAHVVYPVCFNPSKDLLPLNAQDIGAKLCEECYTHWWHDDWETLVNKKIKAFENTINSPQVVSPSPADTHSLQDKAQVEQGSPSSDVTLTAKGVSDCDKTADTRKGKEKTK